MCLVMPVMDLSPLYGTGRPDSVTCAVGIWRSGTIVKNQALLLFVLVLLLGCTAKVDNRYNVDIRWTSYGIPHVKADDWGSLGYGFA